MSLRAGRRRGIRERRRGVRHGQPERRRLGEVIAVASMSLSFVAVFAFAYSREPATPQRYGAVYNHDLSGESPSAATVRPTATSAEGAASSSAGMLTCSTVRVVDGDTLRCGQTRVRLASIDAPELPGHCRRGRECTPGDPYASTGNLQRLVAAQAVTCRPVDMDRYGRTVAYCEAAGRDLSCAQIGASAAVVRYGDPMCDRAGKPHDRRLG